MCKIILFSIFILSLNFSHAQDLKNVKDSFTFKGIPTVDRNGNLYMYEKRYDHLPSKQDTIDFYKEMDDVYRPMIDSVEMEHKRIDEMNRAYDAKQKQYAQLFPREGKHLISLQWIALPKFGSVNIKKINTKKYSIKGSQKDDKGNYVTIDGILIPVTKGKLKFTGEIVTRVSRNNNGVACVKKGVYTFLCKRGSKFWRLQENENCEGGVVFDVINIFF